MESDRRTGALRELRELARRIDPELADDLVQEAWIATRDHAPSGSRRGWLAAVLRNLSRLRRRADRRRRVREHVAARSESVDSAAERAEREELARRLRAALDRLPEPYRGTVRQRFFAGRTAAEIARAEGVPGSTVRNRLRRALVLLRAGLGAAAALAFWPVRRPARLAAAAVLVGLPLAAVASERPAEAEAAPAPAPLPRQENPSCDEPATYPRP